MLATPIEAPTFDDEFVWIARAPLRWRISRATLDRLADRGELHKHRRPGDHKVYLEIAECDRVLRPKRVE